jgi:ribosome biogenesis GTPase
MDSKEELVNRHIKGMQKQHKKQQVREACKKAGTRKSGKRPRVKKISVSHYDSMDDLEEMGFNNIEPMKSRDVLRDRREIEKSTNNRVYGRRIQKNTNPEGHNIEKGKSGIIQGLVIEAVSGMCRVDLNGKTLLCDIRGKIKDSTTGFINPVAVGDHVLVSRNGLDRGVVENILPRQNVLARPYSPDQGKYLGDLQQIIVANVDRLLIVASWREPYIWPAMIDRYLIAAVRNNLRVIICINKTDLIDDIEGYQEIVGVYQRLGYDLIQTSVVTKSGIDDLGNILKDGLTVLTGLSGVGKSSLLTSIQPSLNLKTGKVSEHGLFTGQGRHTTSSSNLIKLDSGGWVVDTPGVRSFALAGIHPLELANWYPEMVPYIKDCNFGNCTHIDEPGCGVLSAVQKGSVSHLRYKNYKQIFDELTALTQ